VRRRRKGSGGVWLPVYGNHDQAATLDRVIGARGTFAMDRTGGIIYDAFAVTFDDTQSAYNTQSGVQNTLRDIVEGQEWSLRRIVGKHHIQVWADRNPENQNPIWPAWEVASGYIVLKTDEEGNPTADLAETNPLVQESAEDPWIWRRKWILSCVGPLEVTSVPPAGGLGEWYQQRLWPFNTAGYGSVLDGPHVDQKTGRRIHRQERLYCMIACRPHNPSNNDLAGEYNVPYRCGYAIDHRFFGRLGSSRGNRRNASR